MDKIITNLIGGAGNQMFQYAAGYAAAKNAGLPLFADISSFDVYKIRSFELEKFGFKINIANEDDIARLNKKHLFKNAVAAISLIHAYRAILVGVLRSELLSLKAELGKFLDHVCEERPFRPELPGGG